MNDKLKQLAYELHVELSLIEQRLDALDELTAQAQELDMGYNEQFQLGKSIILDDSELLRLLGDDVEESTFTYTIKKNAV